MVNINEEFPSKYLKSADLQGNMVKVKIRDVLSEQIGADRKLIMYFQGKDKGMVLNKTNARTIGDVYGDDTDSWINASIELFSMKVDFQGRMVDGLRVRVPPPPKSPPKAQPNGNATVVPNARDRAMQSQPAGDERPFSQADPLDDEIPF